MSWILVRRVRRGSIGLALALGVALGPWSAGAQQPPAPVPQVAPAVYPTSMGGWVDRSGFSELISRSVTEGVIAGSLVGFSLVGDTGADRVWLGGLIGAASGLALPLLLSTGEVRTGDVVFMNAAQGIGLANGLLLPMTIQVAGCEFSVDTCPFLNVNTVRIDAALGAFLSVGAGAATLLVNRQVNFTPGQAEALGSAAIWGALVGSMVAYAITPSVNSFSLFLGATLVGADMGFIAAWWFRDFFDMDRARIGFLDVGVFLGAVVGVALAYFVNPGFASTAGTAIAVVAGSAAGWAVAYYATSGLDGYKRSAPPERVADAGLRLPSLRPYASLARGEQSFGLQVDLLQGRF